jgi:hypothetical protein
VEKTVEIPRDLLDHSAFRLVFNAVAWARILENRPNPAFSRTAAADAPAHC